MPISPSKGVFWPNSYKDFETVRYALRNNGWRKEIPSSSPPSLHTPTGTRPTLPPPSRNRSAVFLYLSHYADSAFDRTKADIVLITMRLPLIGITVDYENDRYTTRCTIAKMIARAGGIPILLPCLSEFATQYAKACDGLILSGGDDPIMEHWGITTHEKAITCLGIIKASSSRINANIAQQGCFLA